MWESRYLLDIEELTSFLKQNTESSVSFAEDSRYDEIMAKMMACLDKNRIAKANRLRGEAKLQSMGAGLLLQKAYQDYQRKYESRSDWAERPYSVSELLEELEKTPPAEYELQYGKSGKPYFSDIPLFFSLSHSASLVLCVVSEQEIGADIQQHRSLGYPTMAKRFFAPEEYGELMALQDEKAQMQFFYGLWTAKEAYGKYTGEGILPTLDQRIEAEHFRLEKQMINTNGENYSICICSKV